MQRVFVRVRARSSWGRATALAAGLSIAACAPVEPERWQPLTASTGGIQANVEADELVLEGGNRLRLAPEGSDVRVEISLPPEGWELQPEPRLWLAKLPLFLPGEDQADPARFRLGWGPDEFPLTPYRVGKKSGLQPYTYRARSTDLLVLLAQDEAPTVETRLSFVLRNDGGAGGRVQGRRFSGRGFQVWPGQRMRVALDVPRGAALRFATTLDPILRGANAGDRSVVFRVLQDGEPVFEHVERDSTRSSYAWHALELPRSGEHSELVFEVHGTLATTCFLDPILGPMQVGTPAHRPWDEPRGDIVLFLADTFRADSMAAYGGTLGLTPNLDRCAEASLLFRRAWSVGTFTLPAHLALFAGVMPGQAGLRTLANAMPEELETITERLAAHGYRTGAITDSGIVSRRFGFDQGFHYFDEDGRTLDDTLARARAFLEADDGRPVFLFVHTYRAHMPYRVSDEARRSLGDTLGIAGEFKEIKQRLLDLTREQSQGDDLWWLTAPALRSEKAAPSIRDLRALYLGGVADLDRGFGDFCRTLEDRRWFEHGWLVFTSDHGEAFGEHGELAHGTTAFEEKIRIPFLVRGKGIAPRVSDHAASLIDLAPTLAELAGLARLPEWMGESVLGLRRDRPILSFGAEAEPTFAVIEGSRKLIGFEAKQRVDRQRIFGAFDLARDPREQHDAAASGETWPAEMLQRFRPEVERALKPIVEARPARLGDSDLEELRKLGYTDR